jgi:hypothetical protein
MKIQSILVRAGGTHVTFDENDNWPAGNYHFKPETNEPGAPHVCEVTDEAHIHRFLSLPESFRVWLGDDIEQPSGPAKRSSAAGLELTAGGGESGAVVPPKQPEGETSPAVAEIRELSIKDLKGKINTYAKDDLLAALEAEKASTEEAPRKGWIEVIEAHLGVGG